MASSSTNLPSLKPFKSFQYQVSEKLTGDNLPLWLQQVEPVLRAHKLHRFCVSPEVPTRYLTDADRLADIENPAYVEWELQDQLLLAWLQSSLSPSILAKVIGCRYTFQLWEKIHQHSHAKTKAQARQLRAELHNTKKGERSITEFFARLKTITDALLSIGETISLQEQYDVVLQGLPAEYESITTLLSTKSEWFEFEELEALLLAHESRIAKQTDVATAVASLNLSQAISKTESQPKSIDDTAVTADTIPQAQFTASRGNFRGGRGGRFGSGGRGRGRNNVQCQVCSKFGHSASVCYHRYTPQFAAPAMVPNFGNPYQYVRPGYVPPTANTTVWQYPSAAAAAPPTAHATMWPQQAVVPQQALFQPMVPQAFAVQAAPTFTASNLTGDTAASHHMSGIPPNPATATTLSGQDHVFLGNGQGLKIHSISSESVPSPFDPKRTLHFKNILYVPQLTKNLLSIKRFNTDNNAFFQFHPSHCFAKSQDDGATLLCGKGASDGLYHIPGPSSAVATPLVKSIIPQVIPQANVSVSAPIHISSTSTLWHNRLGHPNIHVLNSVLSMCNKPIINKNKIDFCVACCVGKHHKLPSQPSTTVYSHPLELIFCDLWGPAPMVSSMGYKYYISFVDAFSRYTWIYFLKVKSDALSIFTQFQKLVENQFNCKIKAVQSDWGGEFRPFSQYLASIGVVHRLICPHTHHQNGVIERKHRHIVDMGLSLLSQASLPLSFWDHSFHTSVYLINRLPSPHQKHSIPYTTLYQKPPDFSFLKVFGCSCFPLLRPYHNQKFQFRSAECIFLGYSANHKGYKCLDATGRLFVSKDVIFNENAFPYPNLFPTKLTKQPATACTLQPLGVVPFNIAQPTTFPNPTATSPSPNPPNSPYTTSLPSTASSTINPDSPAPSIPSAPQSPAAPLPPLPTNTHPMITRSKNGIVQPRIHPTLLLTTAEPNSVNQALSCPKWKQAMQSEYDALIQNGTWSLVPLPAGRKAVGSKWIFRIKENSDGTINKYKARLVAKGFNQREGTDYSETFAPVIKPITVRIILTLALTHKWSLKQIDINNAFLNGFLEEEVYMSQPQGFEIGDKSLVCKLHKALYGLKQAPRAWYERLTKTLISFGFIASKCDSSLLVYAHNGCCIYTLVYVDDIIITGSSPTAVQSVIDRLTTVFALKQFEALDYFLGIEVKATSNGCLLLTQTKYLKEILSRAGMDNAKGISTPLPAKLKLSKHGADYMADPSLYRSIVGALQYATITRPEIGYAVNKACQFLSQPLDTHWVAVKRILRYLKGSLDLGLVLRPAAASVPFSLQAYCDADWASDIDDRRSTSGACIYLGPNLISWWSKKQTLVAKSSAEAEYRSLALAASELLWVQSLLHELKVPHSTPVIFCDNQSTVAMSHNPVLHSRTKHMELDLFFVREKVLSKSLIVCHVPAEAQLADILTKPLAKAAFCSLRDKLNVSSFVQLST